MAEWISVSDREPGFNEVVLLYSKAAGGRMIGQRAPHIGYYILGLGVIHPSHWMPIPPPPSQRTNGDG